MVKLVTVILQEHQYEWLAEMGREDKLMPSQVLVKIVGDYRYQASVRGNPDELEVS